MGTLLAVGFYKLMKTVEYQTVNPGQDFNDHEAELFEPPPVPATAEEVRRPNVAAIAVEGMVRTASLGDRVDREKFKHAGALGKILEVSGVDDL